MTADLPAARQASGRRRFSIRASTAWLVVVPALFLVVPALWAPVGPPTLGLLAACVVPLLARRHVGWGTIALLAAVGVLLRLGLAGMGWSDVLAVTRSAFERLQGGLDPWGFGYPSSVPPGAPFAYGPLALVWYLPFGGLDLRWAELVASLAVLAALAWRGRSLGLAVYALSPGLAWVATDGSNDTTAGVFLLLALVVARRSWVAGGVALAAAAAFKPYALAWLPGLVAQAGLPGLAAFAVGSGVAWGPALVAFGPVPILESFRQAAALHDQPAWSLAAWVQRAIGGPVPRDLFEGVRWLGGGVAALAALKGRRTWAGFLAIGLAIYLVVLYAGFWSSSAYLAAPAPILCWELDELAGTIGGGARRAAARPSVPAPEPDAKPDTAVAGPDARARGA